MHPDVRAGLVGEERVAALESECARLVVLAAVRVRLLRADGARWAHRAAARGEAHLTT
ncbi:hypothetical protein [Nocardia sp. alder85J]|uniref:hypothetical protein n=1 Tax=Nocardia sp. alder85J TaxID=2862949 RepID=UPI003A4E141B